MMAASSCPSLLSSQQVTCPLPGVPAWQTAASQTSTGPQTDKRMGRMATLPTALPTGRMDTTVGRLHMLEQQVGTQIRVSECFECVYACARSSGIDWTAYTFCQTGRQLWTKVIGSIVPGKGSQSPKGVCTDPAGSRLTGHGVCSGPVVGSNTKYLKSMKCMEGCFKRTKDNKKGSFIFFHTLLANISTKHIRWLVKRF